MATRAFDPNDTRQQGAAIQVYDETSLRAALATALKRTNRAHHPVQPPIISIEANIILRRPLRPKGAVVLQSTGGCTLRSATSPVIGFGLRANAANAGAGVSSVTLRGLRLEYTGTTAGYVVQYTAGLNYSDHVIERCSFNDDGSGSGPGTCINSPASAVLGGMKIDGCTFSCGTGVTVGATASSITNNNFAFRGLDITSGSWNTITGNQVTDGTINTVLSSGGNVLAANPVGWAKSLHPTDIDDDIVGTASAAASPSAVAWLSAGDQGDDGERGPQGLTGPQGTPGTPGVPGHIMGDAGEEGERGPPGVAGTNGVDGRPGPPGTTGDDGDDGALGPPGAPGAVGNNGPAGVPVYLEAEQGDQGDAGPPGPQGYTGPTGPAGPAVYLETDPPEEGAPGTPGAPGITGPTGPTGPAAYLEAEAGDEGPWTMGPQGPTGPQGAPGVAAMVIAEDGIDGERGPPGVAGPPGPAGVPVYLEADAGEDGAVGPPAGLATQLGAMSIAEVMKLVTDRRGGIILDATTKKLQIVLKSAVITREMVLAASYIDVKPGSYVQANAATPTTGITAVDLVAAPAAITQRLIKQLNVYNDDTELNVVTIRIVNSVSGRTIILGSWSLDSQSTLQYNDALGFSVLDVSGRKKKNLAFGNGRLLRAPQVFTAGGTWSRPSNCNQILVEILGAGGGGGGAAGLAANAAAGGGGGGGGYCRKFYDSLPAALTSATFTQGFGGNGGTSAGGTGTAGGNSTWVGTGLTTLTAKGGGGGTGASAGNTPVFTGGGQSTGVSTGGDVNGTGTPGQNASRQDGTMGRGGNGGVSLFGGPGLGPIASAVGVAAVGYGAGGSGALCVNNSPAGCAGGTGSGGICIVWEFT